MWLKCRGDAVTDGISAINIHTDIGQESGENHGTGNEFSQGSLFSFKLSPQLKERWQRTLCHSSGIKGAGRGRVAEALSVLPLGERLGRKRRGEATLQGSVSPTN